MFITQQPCTQMYATLLYHLLVTFTLPVLCFLVYWFVLSVTVFICGVDVIALRG